jgi:hypothetical protein
MISLGIIMTILASQVALGIGSLRNIISSQLSLSYRRRLRWLGGLHLRMAGEKEVISVPEVVKQGVVVVVMAIFPGHKPLKISNDVCSQPILQKDPSVHQGRNIFLSKPKRQNISTNSTNCSLLPYKISENQSQMTNQINPQVHVLTQ